MKWQHYPKMYFHLFIILVTIGGLLGAPVDEDILDRLISVNTSEDLKLLSRSHSVHELSTKSTVMDNGKQELLHTDQSLTATVGLSIDNRETGNALQSEGMESVSEETSTSSKHLLNLVTVQPTEMIASSHTYARNTQAKHLNLVSTKPLLSKSSIGSTTELSSGDEKPAWHGRLTPTIAFSTQSPFWYMGSSLPRVQDLPSSSVLDSALPSDEMELSTISSEGAESSAYKLISAEQTVAPRSESTTESILHVFSTESDVVVNATSMTSAILKQLSTSWSMDSSGSPSSAQGNHWQDVSEDIYSTASSSIGTSWPSPAVSEDVYSTAASSPIRTRWPSPAVSEDVYSTADAASIGTSWPSPAVSEGEHCNSVATTWSSCTSAAEFSTALPYTQLSISEEIVTTNELPGASEYFSLTSSSPNFQPSASGALSASSYWDPNTFEELSTSVDNTSYVAPETSSIIGSYTKPSESGMRLFTMVTAARMEPEVSSSTESSKTASYTHVSVIRNPLLLQFDILDRNYTDDLSNKSSEAYKELEIVVKATLDPIFSARYGDSFLETKILNFANGSVKVKSELVFQNDAVLPSSSDVVRTVLTHVYRKDLVPTDLEIDANSVVCNGYSLANLVPERMTIEFTALSTGFGPWSDDSAFYPELLEHLKNLVVETLEEKYLVQEFNITRSIRLQGDVNLQATALLITSVHVDDVEALQLLSNLVNNSVDLRSLKVNGSGVNVGVLPISFLITNRKYNSTLRDSRSVYFCSLGKAVTQALQMILQPNYGHFMQAVIKQFGRGSVFVTSDLVFLNNLPTSHEVLDLFFNSIDSRSVLAGTDFAVDPYSFFVGGARLDRPYERIHFPGFGIAIILLCGLAIVSLPILAFLCWKYRFCAACQKSFAFEAWDVERENASNIPLPEVNPESYRLREPIYVNYSFNS
ncbi:uncharacterized protein si:ch211-217k17.9 [Rhincodon typus]|uniref:uncharacterized protein si:ch211-217k17.9 n=1 Tax=Rhincodon typus TaxID=259920 RepID=UPI00202EB9FB|nr:uncharacterized protein si:ch211-217k17.9 [Rhincodon typus]